jgi:hypothetical protein
MYPWALSVRVLYRGWYLAKIGQQCLARIPSHPYGQTKALAKMRRKVAFPLAGGHFKLKLPEPVL